MAPIPQQLEQRDPAVAFPSEPIAIGSAPFACIIGDTGGCRAVGAPDRCDGRLAATQDSSIAMNVLVMNLQKLLKLLLSFLFSCGNLWFFSLGIQSANQGELSDQVTGA